MTEKKIVEVKVVTDDGKAVPIGIMNANQATELSDDLEVVVSRSDEAGAADSAVGQNQSPLADHNNAYRKFPRPSTDVGAQRVTEAETIARETIDGLIASANEAGWGTDEIIAAFLTATRSLQQALRADPDPADDPDGCNVADEQIGHGEQYD